MPLKKDSMRILKYMFFYVGSLHVFFVCWYKAGSYLSPLHETRFTEALSSILSVFPVFN